MRENYEQTILKIDLARNAHRVLREAQRGCTHLLESHGQPEVDIVDIVDFQPQRAALCYVRLPKKDEDDFDKFGESGRIVVFNTSTDGFRKSASEIAF